MFSPPINLDDLDITGFLHKELIFPKLPTSIPNIYMVQLNPRKGPQRDI